MCNFFSFCIDEFGKKYYFDAEMRKQGDNGDSHSHICKIFGVDEDKVNKFEYNPLTKKFNVDQINSEVDNSIQAQQWAENLDYLKIAHLIVKPIIHPFKDFPNAQVTNNDIVLLKKWNSVRDSVWNSVGDSVRNSVGNSVRDSVRDSVRNSVGNSVWNSVRDSVWNSVWNSVRDSVWNSVGNSVWNSVRDSVWNSVWDSVRDSVRNSVGNSVWDSVRDSVYTYFGTFFDIWEKPYQFSCAVDLWEKGLVPAFSLDTAYLVNSNGIVFQCSLEELRSK